MFCLLMISKSVHSIGKSEAIFEQANEKSIWKSTLSVLESYNAITILNVRFDIGPYRDQWTILRQQ